MLIGILEIKNFSIKILEILEIIGIFEIFEMLVINVFVKC